MEARLCILMFEDLLQYKEFHITGVLAWTGSLILEQLRGINYTVVREPGIGTMIDVKTQQYDGCIGSLQKNESDFMLTVGLLTVPVVGPNLTHTVVDGFERMGILSAYNRLNVNDASHTQVLDMVFSFSPGLWILLAFSIIALFMLLNAATWVRAEGLYAKHASRLWATRRILVSRARKSRRSASKSAWNVVACILKQHSSCGSCHVNFGPISIMYTIITLLCFFAGFYLTSMIKTDMVVVKPPITVTTYDEVIQSGRRPMWFRHLTEKSHFEHAAIGSKEKEIWDIAVSKGLNESLAPSTVESVISHGPKVGRLKEVVFLYRQLGVRFVPYSGCTYSRANNILTHTNILYTHDPSATEKLRGNIDNPLVSSQISKKRNKRIQWTFEAGLLDVTLNRFTDISFYIPLAQVDKCFRSIDECSSNVVTIPYPEPRRVNSFHFLSLFIMTSIMFLFSSMIRVLEK